MITIDFGTSETYNPETNTFEYSEIGLVRFEYSLKAIYEWESKWKKPFLKGGLSHQELLDFYKKMALDPIQEDVITEDVMRILADYIKDSNTATTFSSEEGGQNGSTSKMYTAEELYALMFMANIPMEFENRNVNRLLVVLRIISSYNTPRKKMSKADIIKQNAELNAKRKKQLNTKG